MTSRAYLAKAENSLVELQLTYPPVRSGLGSEEWLEATQSNDERHQAQSLRSMGYKHPCVSLDQFSFIDRSGRDPSRPVVVMLGRLLNQKGIPLFAEVGRRVRNEIPDARFFLAGEEDPIHSDSVDMAWLRSQTNIDYVGRLTDVRPLLEKADLLLFPSSYREGVPRVVMEAAATGLATVAFDVPGVREAGRDDVTGYLVPNLDVDIMTKQVIKLLRNEAPRLEFGLRAYELAKASFDIHSVQEAYLKVYRNLGVTI